MRNQRQLRPVVACVVATSAFAQRAAAARTTPPTGPNGEVKLTWWHNGTEAPLKDVLQQTPTGFHKATSGRLDQDQPDPERAVHDQGPGRAAVEQPARRLPAVGRRPAGDADPLRQGHRHHRRDQVRGRAIGSSADGGRSTASSTVPLQPALVGFWYRTTFSRRRASPHPPPPSMISTATSTSSRPTASPRSPSAARTAGPTPSTGATSPSRLCRPHTLQQAIKDLKFNDPCFLKAGQDLQDFLDIKPFQNGFLGTPAQQGAAAPPANSPTARRRWSSRATGTSGVVADLRRQEAAAPSSAGSRSLPSTAAPAIPNARFGGGDGFSCTRKAPPACADFLNFLLSKEKQTQFVSSGAVRPVDPACGVGYHRRDPARTPSRSSQKLIHPDLLRHRAADRRRDRPSTTRSPTCSPGKSSPEKIVQSVSDAAANE